MTVLGTVGLLALALIAWHISERHKRALRRASDQLARFHVQADERAAAAALRPSTGDVAASPQKPPNLNGNHR